MCLSPFTPDAELRLIPACRHAFHAACVDAWLRTTPSCPLCRAAFVIPHPASLSAMLAIDEEVEAVVSRATCPVTTTIRDVIVKEQEDKPDAEEAPSPPGEAVAKAAGPSSHGWLRDYVDRLASTAYTFFGRWSSRWARRATTSRPGTATTMHHRARLSSPYSRGSLSRCHRVMRGHDVSLSGGLLPNRRPCCPMAASTWLPVFDQDTLSPPVSAKRLSPDAAANFEKDNNAKAPGDVAERISWQTVVSKNASSLDTSYDSGEESASLNWTPRCIKIAIVHEFAEDMS
ncbi:hypothetical protein PR202_ga31419 [Eleusine coracana subsp. coracana]|uniref:RING-type domain-containing protein n=1 Tax=Eleusine coracana subsp. coracana TaxID=191504 RepID=A0AAV5DRN2_ELECO|nr:hypothetical protein PR202_ga31419 [Eleusine coracana subsp. coracana]